MTKGLKSYFSGWLVLVGALLFTVLFGAGIAESEDGLPSALVHIDDGVTPIIVDKSRHRLTIYTSGGEVIKSYRVTTGKVKGDKLVRGDLKTPEGVFFFNELIDGKDLPSRYGVMAIPMDYPNPVDKLGKKTGSGIWLHGTDDPARILRPRDSKGCVVVTNEDMLDIASYINLARTPIVVVKEAGYISAAEKEGIKRDVLKFLTGNVKYSRYKKGMSIISHNEVTVVSSTEAYELSTKVSNLYLEKKDGHFKVLGEKSFKASGQEPGELAKRIISKLN